jgi:YfiH family protein
MAETSVPSPISQPHWSALHAWMLPSVIHGFMTREGGVSAGLYSSFNLAEGIGDRNQAVRQNWELWRAAYPMVRVTRLRQVHGNQMHTISRDYDGTVKVGDGMVTAEPGIVLAIFTADCVPVLMVDAEAAVVGAVHAGWRGVLADIAGAGVHAMVALGAVRRRIRVALGPSIGICCFEVDVELADQFARVIPYSASYRRGGRQGKMYLDLRGIIRLQMERAGLLTDSITNVGPCTKCSSNRFFARRAAQGASTGLQMSFIGLRSEQ